MGAGPVLVLSVLLLAAGAPLATAHDESAAPAMRADVEAVWHDPANVTEGAPWKGYLRLSPGSNVTSAYFQVCRVGMACFAPPAAATMEGPGLYSFHSSQAGGEVPIEFGAGWRVGVKWHLFEGESQRPVEFPPKASCAEPTPDCYESEYFVFEVAPGTKETPSPFALVPLLGAVGFAVWRRGVRGANGGAPRRVAPDG